MKNHVLERDDTTVITFDDPVPDELTDQEAKSESLFEQLRSDPNSYINVMRQPLGGRNTMEFVARYEADQFDYGGMMAHIQKMYGGGDYRIMAYYQGKLKGNKLVTIAHPIKQDVPESSSLNVVLQQMEKMQQQMVNLMQEKQTGVNSRKEMLEEMLMYKQLFGGESRQGNGIKDVIDTLGSLQDLGIDIGIGGGDKEKGWTELAEKFLPLATMALTPQPHPPRVMRTNPQARPVNPQPVNPQPSPQENQKMNMFVKMGVAQLVSAASKKSDPADYAGLVIDNVPEPVLKQIIVEENFATLRGINPKVGDFIPWFKELVEHIKARLGLPSTVSDLYDDEEDDTLDENESASDINGDLPTTANS